MSWLWSMLVLTMSSTAGTPAGRAVIMTVPIERGGWPEADRAIEREFALLGIETVWVPAPESSDWNEALTDASKATASLAAVCIVRKGSARSVYLWVRDAVTDKALVRRFDTSNSAGDFAPVTLALKVVELLQASLLEVQVEPALAVPAAAQPLVEVQTRTAPTSWTLRLGGSWLSGVPPLVVVDASLQVAPVEALEFDFGVGGGAAAGTLSSELGAVQLGLARARLAVLWRVKTQGRVGVAIGAGGSLIILMGQGSAPAAGLISRLDATAIAEVFGRVRLDYQGDHFVLGAHLELGAWLPKTVVFLGGQPATAWGFPVVSAGLSGGWRW